MALRGITEESSISRTVYYQSPSNLNPGIDNAHLLYLLAHALIWKCVWSYINWICIALVSLMYPMLKCSSLSSLTLPRGEKKWEFKVKQCRPFLPNCPQHSAIFFLSWNLFRDFPSDPVVRYCAFTAGGTGLIPGQGTKTLDGATLVEK